jgi:hypothetical protein
VSPNKSFTVSYLRVGTDTAFERQNVDNIHPTRLQAFILLGFYESNFTQTLEPSRFLHALFPILISAASYLACTRSSVSTSLSVPIYFVRALGYKHGQCGTEKRALELESFLRFKVTRTRYVFNTIKIDFIWESDTWASNIEQWYHCNHLEILRVTNNDADVPRSRAQTNCINRALLAYLRSATITHTL